MASSRSGRRRLLEATAALAPFVAAAPVLSADLDVTNARSSAVTTSNIDGGGPGNVKVESNGSISIGTTPAVTIDSSNTVSNAGTISTSTESGANAILANTGAAGTTLTSGITNSGTLSVPGPASGSALINTNVFNAGIRVQGLGTFAGAISNSGTINVGGQSSYGVAIQGATVGDLTNTGTISMSGVSNTGIFTTGPLTGSITNSGTISAGGSGGIGMYIGNTVSGTILQSGTITVGTPPTADPNNIDPKTGIAATLPEVHGTAGIWLAGSVNQGLLLAGNGYTKAQEAANTSISTAGDSTLTVNGAPGILVAPGGAAGYQNIVIGQRPDAPFGIVNNGNLIVNSAIDNEPAVGLDVHGATVNGTNYTAALSGGFFNAGGNVNVTAINGQGIGVHVGAGGTVPELRNSGDILVTTIDNTADNSRGFVGTKGGTAYGVLVEAGGTMNTFTNTGNLTVLSQGPNSSYGVIDRSGTISTFFNSGKITPIIDKLSTGTIIGVDLSANTSGITWTNNGTITGPVFLGSGNNTFTMGTANQYGNVTFAGGNNTLTVDTSIINGNISLGAGASTVSLTNSTLNGALFTTGAGTANFSATNKSHIVIPDSQPMRVTNASFDSTSTLTFNVNGANPNGGVLIASGNVSVASGAVLTPVFTGLVTSSQTFRLITAGSLSLGMPASSIVAPNLSYMNVYSSQLDPTNPNTLLLNVRRKSAGEIGLDPNMSAVYNGFIGALVRDPGAATALSVQSTRPTFIAALRQFMPDVTDATRQVALAGEDLTVGAIRRRLAGVADQAEPGEHSSIWFQALGSGADAKLDGDEAGYSYWGVGVAIGADAALGQATKLGFSVSEMFTSVNLNASPNSPLFIYGTHANVYGRQGIGPLYLEGMVGGAYNSYRQTRNVTIDAFKRTAAGHGNGYQAGGTLEIGTNIDVGSFVLDPYVRGAYLRLHRGTYAETGGGDGINLQTDANNQTSMRGSVGLNVERDFSLYYDSVLETDLRGSYTHEFRNTPTAFNSHFVSDGTNFTNTVLLHGPSFYSAGFSIGHKDSFSSVTLDYDAQLANKFIGHVATVTLRFRL